MTECKSYLETADEVIDALGGTAAVMQLVEAKSSSVISNWRKFGAFPPRTFHAMTIALAAKKKQAPASLWKMREPAA